MAHTPQHARKRTYTTSEKVLALALILAVVGMVTFLWVASVTHPVAAGIAAHGLNPIINPTYHPVIQKAASTATGVHTAAGAIVGGTIAGAVKKVAVKHYVVKHLAKHYVVKSGDTLWGIAQKTLHNPLKWKQIYALNHGVIGADPNKIVAGQSLLL
jgi:nucleoid-associated protein YgaU